MGGRRVVAGDQLEYGRSGGVRGRERGHHDGRAPSGSGRHARDDDALPGKAPAELRGIASGMRVRFRYDGKLAQEVRAVRSDEAGMPAPERTLHPGDPAPDFQLIDQRGQAVRVSDLHGTVVAINFLYTRCPVPEVCPRLAAAFAAAHRRFQDAGLVLLSITIDPVYDTPAVLAAYAKLWRARPANGDFLPAHPSRLRASAGTTVSCTGRKKARWRTRRERM